MIKKTKTQVLLVALFMMYLLSALSIGLLNVWEPTLDTAAHQEFNTAAFYLAQAGIERAKAMLLENTGNNNPALNFPFQAFGGTWYWPGPTNTDFHNGLDPDQTDAVSYEYQCHVSSLSGANITISGKGQVRNTITGDILGQRQIKVAVSGIVDADSDGFDDDAAGSIDAFSWREL